MASDLKDLEKRLNTDTAARDEFIKNPVKYLKAEGVSLTPVQGRDVAAAIAKVKVPKAVPGTKARAVKIIIGISVGVKKAATD